VDDLLPAPEGLPDLQSVILPSRACLLAVRDTLVPARRSALEDSVGNATGLVRARRQQDLLAMAALECLWEAISCLELAATVAAPWVDPRLPDVPAAYVEMARYDPTRATRFYQSSKNWTDERFRVLSAHRFRHGDEASLLGLLVTEGMIDERLREAFEQAEEATARFLRERFTRLVEWWESMSRYAASFEHGALLIPAELAEVRDGDEVLDSSFSVFETRKDSARGHTGGSINDAVYTAEAAGQLAVDLAYHVADARLRTVEAIEIRDGRVFLRPLRDPFPFWCRKGDLPPETLELLQGVTLGWIRVEDEDKTAGDSDAA
jgi:hypothetical protein